MTASKAELYPAVVVMLNGTNLIFDDEQLIDLVTEKCGEDVGDILRERLKHYIPSDMDDDKRSDLRELARELEDAAERLRDIVDDL